MITQKEFSQRRQQLIKQLPADSIAIIAAAPEIFRNNDNHYTYRQDSSFYYLTGFAEPEAVAIIIPGRVEGEFVLFNRVRDESMETWYGYRAGQDGACEDYNAKQAYPIETFEEKLPELLSSKKQLFYAFSQSDQLETIIRNSIGQLSRKVRAGVNAPDEILNLENIIFEMRLIKSDTEIAMMRKAAEISSQAIIAAMQSCQPEQSEYELEAELRYVYGKNGSRTVAYDPIVASGNNACILHYNDNNQKVNDGDLVLIDAGCEYQYYAADITRAFPVNGKYSDEQSAIYELVLKSQLAVIDIVKPGLAWPELQKMAARVITEGLIELGILNGDLETLIENKDYFQFYMHQSGHWLGMDVHDVGKYNQNGQWRTLQAGMVLTVEPGIYIKAGSENIDKKWWGIGIRIEDDVLVTKNGSDVLSKDVPKTIPDIETLMSKK